MASEIMYRQYIGESDLPHVMALVQNELSEPYVIYTFRYFLHQWPVLLFVYRYRKLTPISISRPHLSFLVSPPLPAKHPKSLTPSPQAYPSDPSNSDPIGVIVCKQSMHRDTYNRGYIAMLSVSKSWRKRGIGSSTFPSLLLSSREIQILKTPTNLFWCGFLFLFSS